MTEKNLNQQNHPNIEVFFKINRQLLFLHEALASFAFNIEACPLSNKALEGISYLCEHLANQCLDAYYEI